MRDGWVEATLREALEPIANRPNGKDYPLVLSVTEKRGIIPQTEIFNHRIATDDISKYKVLEPMDIAYNPYLLWCGAIGQWQGTEAGVVSPVYECFRVKSNCEPRYLGYIFETGILTNYFDALAIGSIVRRRRTIPSDFIAAPIQLPPLPEQKRIVDLISSVDSYIEALQKQLESAKKSRNAVLHKLLTAGGDDWVEGKVGDISVLRYGFTESANWDPIGPKFLRITDIQDGQVDWDLVPYCKISDADLSLQQLEDGDLVFARTGATTGKSFLVTNPPDSVSASYLIRLRPDQSKVNPYYLSIFFQSENYWQQVMAGTSGSAQGGVNASKLSNLKIQVPPLSRQKMISDLIEEMDIHASKIRDSLNRSQKLRSSMLSDLLSGEHEIPASYDKVMGAA